MGHYWRPHALADALRILGETGPRIIAGGSWLARSGEAGVWDGDLLDVSAVEALHGITQQPGEWRIGAATTWSALLATPLPPLFRSLKQAAATLGGPQICNQGTIGGNLLARFPAADGVPVLLSLDATLELARGTSTRRVPLADALAGTVPGPDELLTAILLPAPTMPLHCGFARHGSRRAFTTAAVTAALHLGIVDGRVATARAALGGCVPQPLRLVALEAALLGQRVNVGLAALFTAEALAGTTLIDDLRIPATYRAGVALVLLRRLLLACVEETAA